jgi:hypothetical protein
MSLVDREIEWTVFESMYLDKRVKNAPAAPM